MVYFDSHFLSKDIINSCVYKNDVLNKIDNHAPVLDDGLISSYFLVTTWQIFKQLVIYQSLVFALDRYFKTMQGKIIIIHTLKINPTQM
jgi:hypothetical protein